MGGNDKKEGNARKEAISAETGRKNFDGKLPVISKTKEQAEIISGKHFFCKKRNRQGPASSESEVGSKTFLFRCTLLKYIYEEFGS